ncbi:proteasome complex subunit Rpn13 ubiquitin receptor-domain-containing protein [Scheffersomyces amazonensis]|uniref:proteasome complex subunit Rpn13 ubiquitin receptor-domain-containing protein n=1 Tax=Scheffersomyces amazonensis TaxID=1078765 RepID=UPI00315D9D4D
MSAPRAIKFNAGRVQYDETTHRCTPLAHKGVISIKANAEEAELFDFIWSPKGDVTIAGNVPEKEMLLLMPGDVTFKHISSCTTGRVFALTFYSSGAKYLYWLQDVGDIDQVDKLTEKDINLVKSVNELISLKFDEEEEEEEEEEQEEEQKQPIAEEEESKPEESTAPTRASDFKLPIGSISDFLTIETIENHLEELNTEQIKQLYGDYLPESLSSNPNKSELINVIKSGFFKQSEKRLTNSLREGNGAGYLLAQSLKYDYKGEGVDNFLQGIRQLGAKEKANEEIENDEKDQGEDDDVPMTE